MTEGLGSLLINAGAATLAVFAVGGVVYGVFKLLEKTRVLRLLGEVWEGIFWVFTGTLATLFGLTRKRGTRRFSIMFLWIAGLLIVALLAPLPLALAAGGISVLMLFATFAAWTLSEAEIEGNLLPEDCRFHREDFRDETVIAVLFLFAVTPLVFARINAGTPLIEGTPEEMRVYGLPVGYAAYVLGELVRALPVFDLFEAYEWENPSGLEATQGLGQHAAFSLRVIYDLVIITGILRMISIYNKERRGQRLTKLFNAIDHGPDEKAEQCARAFRPEGDSLLTLMEGLRLRAKSSDWARLWRVLLFINTVKGRLGSADLLEIAVTACRTFLARSAQEKDANRWAAAQYNLGKALSELARMHGSEPLLNEAISAFRAALEEFTQEGASLNWAATQHNLGTALADLAEMHDDADLLEQAITAYHAALEERTQTRVPLDWAMTQNNLGNALRSLALISGSEALLEQAISAYRAALEERTRHRMPLNWAITQSNLGAALADLALMRDNAALLEQALTAYRAALEELTQELVPLNWAMTQNNLGFALSNLALMRDNAALLEQALSAYHAALEEWTQEHAPLDWARTRHNLGLALISKYEMSNGTLLTSLQEAAAIFTELVNFWQARENNKEENFATSLLQKVNDMIAAHEAGDGQSALALLQAPETRVLLEPVRADGPLTSHTCLSK